MRFLSELENEELIVLTCKGIQESVQIFNEFPKIQKSFIKEIGRIWLENPSFKSTFYSFIILREIIKKENSSQKLDTLKRVSLGYFKSHTDFSWRTLETQRFQENCLVELFGQDLETGFVATFEMLKDLSESITKAMETKEIKLVKRLLGTRSLL